MGSSLSEFVGVPAVVVLLVVGLVFLLLSAVLGGRLGQIVAAFIGVLVILSGLGMIFLVWLKRMNEDIAANRDDIKRELDDIVEGEDDQ